jgi:DNA-binding PadR family transcriptional regulator
MSVSHAILGLLAYRPRHGYELHDAFEAMVGGEENWDLNPAQVYSTLARLEKKGLVIEEGVEQEGGPEKRIYVITKAGKEELSGWLETPVRADPQRDEVFVKLILSVALDEANPTRIIYAQRASLYKELHEITVRRTSLDPRKELASLLLMDQAIMHLEADLRWLEMVEARLSEINRQPLPEPEEKPRGRPSRGKNEQGDFEIPVLEH